MKPIIPAITLAAALAACSPPSKPEAPASPAPPPAAAVKTDVTAGDFIVDKPHTSVNFRISHMGFSHFTARFTRIDGTLHFDPAHPEASQVSATIDARSLQTNYPEPQKLNFDAEISGPEFLDAGRFPDITFKSTAVKVTGPNTADITGDFTLHGVTKPLTLATTFNGGYAANAMDPSGARVGFSARGTLKRSDFGIAFGLPAPGTTMGVGDEVEVIIETEFTSAHPPKPAHP